VETSALEIQYASCGYPGFYAVRVSADDGVNAEFVELIDAARIVHQGDGRFVFRYVGEGALRVEVAFPQIAQSNEPERVAVDVQDY